jgi:pSer/pThr/pTyr-binding forkhead associated (FHA) protein
LVEHHPIGWYYYEATVSAQHALVSYENGAWMIYDLNSRNGMVLNGVRIERHVLQNGDQIQIGKTVMAFHCE